jgi:hypothetical protein
MTQICSNILYVVCVSTINYMYIYMVIHYIWLKIDYVHFVAISAVDFFDKTLRADIWTMGGTSTKHITNVKVSSRAEKYN